MYFPLFPCLCVIGDFVSPIFCHLEKEQRTLYHVARGALGLLSAFWQCADALRVPPQPGRGQPGGAGRGRSAATTDSPSAAKGHFTHKKGECPRCWKQRPGGNQNRVLVSDKDTTPTAGSRYPAGDRTNSVSLVAGQS